MKLLARACKAALPFRNDITTVTDLKECKEMVEQVYKGIEGNTSKDRVIKVGKSSMQLLYLFISAISVS